MRDLEGDIQRMREQIDRVRAMRLNPPLVPVHADGLENLMNSYEKLADKVKKTCPLCNGEGKDVDGDPCVACMGGGKL